MSWPPPLSKKVMEAVIIGEPKTAGSKQAGVVRSKKAPNPRTGKPDGKRHPVPVPARDGGTTARTFVTDSSGTPGKTWRSDIQAAVATVRENAGEVAAALDVPLVLEVVFFRPHGKGHYGSGANANTLKDSAPAYPVARPDGTKLSRAFEDALSKIVWRDDALIVSERWDKRFIPIDQPPYVEFELWTLPATIGDLRLAEMNIEQDSLPGAS